MSMFVHPLEGAAYIIYATNRPGQHNFLLQIWELKIYSVPYVFIVWHSQENIYSLLSIRSSFVRSSEKSACCFRGLQIFVLSTFAKHSARKSSPPHWCFSICSCEMRRYGMMLRRDVKRNSSQLEMKFVNEHAYVRNIHCNVNEELCHSLSKWQYKSAKFISFDQIANFGYLLPWLCCWCSLSVIPS